MIDELTVNDFLPSLSDEHVERYFRVVREGIAVRSHSELLRWLQGEVQHYLPHEIMLAIWSDVGGRHLQHDLISALPGVRTGHLHSEDLLTLHQSLYSSWVELGKSPFRLSLGACDFQIKHPAASSGVLTALLQSAGFQPAFAPRSGELNPQRLKDLGPPCAFSGAFHGMRSLLVHGISDERGGQDCLYVIFSSTSLNDSTLGAMENLLSCLDTALRRVKPLLNQPHVAPFSSDAPKNGEVHGLTTREVGILNWVRVGKTNSEIASILGISPYTVKNHMQSIFKKLDVYNRVQAIAKVAQPQP